VYSLVSAPVLGFDLTRLDGGSAVADVLLRALALTAEDLATVAAAGGDDYDRLAYWLDVDSAATGRRRLATAASSAGGSGVANAAAGNPTDADDGKPGPRGFALRPAQAAEDLTGRLAALERAPIGTVDGLLHLVRHDVLDWTWRRHPAGLAQLKPADRVAAVVCDAAVASYLHELLPVETRHGLTAPWQAAMSRLPSRPIDLGPQASAVTALIERVRNLSGPAVRKLVAASSRARPALPEWSAAVHSASWSVFVAGRVRVGAAAQLMLVQAVERAGIPVADRAGGAWNLLSGAVQALVVRDVLDGPTLYRLVDPIVTALGPIMGQRRGD
jgi:hypothetical protein